MININIPGFGELNLLNVLLDYNGTIALNGELISDIVPILNKLAEKLNIHVITGDSFGTAKDQLASIKCTKVILSEDNQAQAKKDYIQKLGCKNTVAIGNGRNDQLMLGEASLSILVMSKEGTATNALMASMLIIPNIMDALELLQNPIKLKAVLRS